MARFRCLWQLILHQLTLRRAFDPYSQSNPLERLSMKLSPWYLAATIPVALLAGGQFGAQIAVLGVTIGIFLGTLALGRPEASGATTTQH